jgi:hypothetical protein
LKALVEKEKSLPTICVQEQVLMLLVLRELGELLLLQKNRYLEPYFISL